MNTKKIIIIAVFILVAVIVLSNSLFVVKESQQAIVTEFGRPVGESITSPGINIKVPFIQEVLFFEKRFMAWDGDPNQVPTKDKKYIFVDTYARWRITDPLQFFKRLTDERGAISRIDDILDGETRDAIASHDLVEAVRTSNRKPVRVDEISKMIDDSLAEIGVGRQKIQQIILERANAQSKDLGIAILDFRFKRINYVEDVREQVFERMRSERYRIADKFRSEGQGEASRINGEKERELQSIQSGAFKEAEEIKGRADAEAAAIYSAAYNKSNMSKELYTFLKSMETLENTIDKETSIFISTDSDLYKYLKNK